MTDSASIAPSSATAFRSVAIRSSSRPSTLARIVYVAAGSTVTRDVAPGSLVFNDKKQMVRRVGRGLPQSAGEGAPPAPKETEERLCGIVGYVGHRAADGVLLAGLRNSSIAVTILRVSRRSRRSDPHSRAVGKLDNLAANDP